MLTSVAHCYSFAYLSSFLLHLFPRVFISVHPLWGRWCKSGPGGKPTTSSTLLKGLYPQ